MDQFRQIGEVLGRLQALMVLKHDISINQKQCCLLFDVYTLAFETISEDIRKNLRLEDKNTKWKALEYPFKELHKKFKEGENYIKYCLDLKDWWGKAISLYQNKECVELHIHNLLCCFPVVIEAIETAAEISALDQDEMQKRRSMTKRKYDTELNDPISFHLLFGKQYLVPREISKRLNIAVREDKWLLLDTVKGRKTSDYKAMCKHEHRLGDFLINQLCGLDTLEVLPSWVLTGATDYHVKQRLGTAKSRIKEIHWLGENFASRVFFGEIEPLNAEISLVLSLSHPNIMQYHCAFYDKEKKEGCLIMDLMQKNLEIYIKENYGQRRKVSLSISVAVDIMLQIARGMEYLHSRKIYHGDLNPSNILLKASNLSSEGDIQAKVTGFGVTSIKSSIYRTKSSNQNGGEPVIWYAPEILAEQEQPGNKSSSKYTDKADIYSFAMLCFELLTGKIPFEDDHLQGDKMVRNIRLGIRPLFPHPSPKYLVNLLRRCWQANPATRPSFSSICRILRYVKKVIVINPDHGQPDAAPPLVDYCDIETGYLNKFPETRSSYLDSVSQIPFQIFAYKIIEEKTSSSLKEKGWDLANEAFSAGRTGPILEEDADDDIFLQENDNRSVQSEVLQRKDLSVSVADLRSVCSESPRRKHLSLADVDCSPLHPTTPENKLLPTSEIPEKDILTTHEPGSTCLENQEKTAQSTITVDKISTPDNIGRKNIQRVATQNSSSTTIPDKKVVRIVRTTHRTRNLPRFKISEKKVPFPKKLIDTKSSTSPSTFKRRSPRTSPKRTLNGVSLPWSSTAKVFTETATRTPKGYSISSPSPWSSPARVFKETPIKTPRENSVSLPTRGKSKCRSQKGSPTQTLSSPWSSPTRTFKDTPTRALKEPPPPPPPRVPKNSSPTFAPPEQDPKKNFITNESKYSSS